MASLITFSRRAKEKKKKKNFLFFLHVVVDVEEKTNLENYLSTQQSKTAPCALYTYNFHYISDFNYLSADRHTHSMPAVKSKINNLQSYSIQREKERES